MIALILRSISAYCQCTSQLEQMMYNSCDFTRKNRLEYNRIKQANQDIYL